jgi:hypothetical protein
MVMPVRAPALDDGVKSKAKGNMPTASSESMIVIIRTVVGGSGGSVLVCRRQVVYAVAWF